MARAGLENCFIRDPDCELWTFSQHGAFSDYDWQCNSVSSDAVILLLW